MDVGLVHMGTNEKRMTAFEEPGGKFIADPVGLLRRDLSGLEGLAHLVGDHVALLLPPGDTLILAPGKGKLRRCRVWVAGVGGDKFAAVCLVRVFTVVDPVRKTLSGGPPLAYVYGYNARGRRNHHLYEIIWEIDIENRKMQIVIIFLNCEKC